MTTTSGRPTAPSAPSAPSPGRLRPGDLASLASIGLRTRKLRATLSALGIAIDGQTLTGGTAELPETAPGMIARLPGVTAVQATGTVNGVSAYRSPVIPAFRTNGLSVDAASLGLPAVAGTSLAQGRFLNAATDREPVAVLGATTAQLLGIDRIRPGMRIWVGGQWFYVTGILNSATYAPELDSAVLVGFQAAQKYLNFDGHPSEIYVRTTSNDQAATTAVDNLLGAQASPENPSQVTGRGRAASRRDRGSQHHGHLRPRAPPGDRAAPRARRH